jgi:rhizosphere induced protein
MVLNFSRAGSPQYSLRCVNQSAQSWYFYLFQRMTDQSANSIYSLVWMISPYKIATRSYMIFVWSPDYCFSWLNTGSLQVGVIPNSGGVTDATPTTGNSATFDIEDDTPKFSAPNAGSPSSDFLIMGGSHIPNSVFSTGIGMSDFAAFAQQSYPNVAQSFSTQITLGLAATTIPLRVSEILSQDNIPNATMFTFPLNTYYLVATLGADNSWTIA